MKVFGFILIIIGLFLGTAFFGDPIPTNMIKALASILFIGIGFKCVATTKATLKSPIFGDVNDDI